MEDIEIKTEAKSLSKNFIHSYLFPPYCLLFLDYKQLKLLFSSNSFNVCFPPFSLTVCPLFNYKLNAHHSPLHVLKTQKTHLSSSPFPLSFKTLPCLKPCFSTFEN